MTESEIHANPQRIEGLAEELRTFVGTLRIELEKMSVQVHELGSTWRDREYERFKRSLELLREDFTKTDQEVIKHEPHLKEDARALLEYLNKSMS